MGFDNAIVELPANIVNVKREENPDNSPFNGGHPAAADFNYSNPHSDYCFHACPPFLDMSSGNNPFSETLIRSLNYYQSLDSTSSSSQNPACAFQDLNMMKNASSRDLCHPDRPIACCTVGPALYPDMADIKIPLKLDWPEVDLDTDAKQQQQQASKRRKNQVKRVVHVPITGTGLKNDNKIEAPPSDSWAWRKYGQKPIKGSPYPRGYYRCSSSKGCSARKQVEKSRSDSTILIVTYTSEHNHPWPTRGRNTNHTNGKLSIISANTSSLDSISNDEYPSTESSEGHDAAISPQYSDFASILNNCCNVSAEEEKAGALHMISESGVADMNNYLDMNLVEDVTRYFSQSSGTQEDNFFDDLGELPELSAIFRPNSLVFGSESADHHHCQQQETISL